MPHEAQAISGEIIHELRSALDNLIYEASRRNNNGVEVRRTQFVIADDEASYRRQEWRLKKLTEQQKSKVESVQPYNNDDKWASLLSGLSNRDKHRYPITLYNHAGINISIRNDGVSIGSELPKWTLAGTYAPLETLETLLYRVCEVVGAFYPESKGFLPALPDQSELVPIHDVFTDSSSRLTSSQAGVGRPIQGSNDISPE